MVNAVYYQARTGCAWRLLPHNLPPYPAVWSRYRRWRDDGTWQQAHDTLRRQLRVALGRHEEPTAGIVDLQSIRTGGKRGCHGYDAGKEVAGRKRHIAVDTGVVE